MLTSVFFSSGERYCNWRGQGAARQVTSRSWVLAFDALELGKRSQGAEASTLAVAFG